MPLTANSILTDFEISAAERRAIAEDGEEVIEKVYERALDYVLDNAQAYLKKTGLAGRTDNTFAEFVENNCGIASGGFQPGNTCAKGGGGGSGDGGGRPSSARVSKTTLKQLDDLDAEVGQVARSFAKVAGKVAGATGRVAGKAAKATARLGGRLAKKFLKSAGRKLSGDIKSVFSSREDAILYTAFMTTVTLGASAASGGSLPAGALAFAGANLLRSGGRLVGNKEFEESVDNVFCPTGAGGGIDPTCSPDKGGGAFSATALGSKWTPVNDTDDAEAQFKVLGLRDRGASVDHVNKVGKVVNLVHGALDHSLSDRLIRTPMGVKTGLSGNAEADFNAQYITSKRTLELSESFVGKQSHRFPTSGNWAVDGSLSGAIRHELGHHLATDLNKLKDPKFNQLFEKYKDNIRVLSTYSRTNPDEFFAETFSAMTHPKFPTAEKRNFIFIPKDVKEYFYGLGVKRRGDDALATNEGVTLEGRYSAKLGALSQFATNIENDPAKLQIVEQTLTHAQAAENPELWYVGYFLALDEGVDHNTAMDVADDFAALVKPSDLEIDPPPELLERVG